MQLPCKAMLIFKNTCCAQGCHSGTCSVACCCAPPAENICVPVRSLAQVIREENHGFAGSAGSPMVYPTQLTNFITIPNWIPGSAPFFVLMRGCAGRALSLLRLQTLLISWFSSPVDESSAMLTYIFFFILFSTSLTHAVCHQRAKNTSRTSILSVGPFALLIIILTVKEVKWHCFAVPALHSTSFHIVLCFLDRQKLFLFFLMNALCGMPSSSQ